ncbi:hypothetical protein OTU49_017213, partial [Cherax quadricarinatus]
SPGPQIVDSRKYINQEVVVNQYTLRMHLTIRDLKPDDFTSYKCTAKNSLGEVEGTIKLYEIELPKPLTTAHELLIETIGEEIQKPLNNQQDLLGPVPDDRHAAAPHQGKPVPTRPLPPMRPQNTHAVPYSPTSSGMDHGVCGSISVSSVMLVTSVISWMVMWSRV